MYLTSEIAPAQPELSLVTREASQMSSAMDLASRMISAKPTEEMAMHLSWDQDDHIFMDHGLHACQSDSALLNLVEGDFNHRLCTRSNSTSTPFGFGSASRKSVPETPAHDSGFSESSMMHAFANSCSITGTVCQRQRLHRTVRRTPQNHQQGHYEDDDVDMPFPKLQLHAEFEAEVAETDSGLGDSMRSSSNSWCPSITSSHESSPVTTDLSNQASEAITQPKATPSADVTELADIESQLSSVLQKFSPPNVSKLIGRKMGLDHMDILLEVSQMDLPCVTTILSYVEDEDLCRMCQVSLGWQSLVEGDVSANRRKRIFQEKHLRNNKGKENNKKRSLSVTPHKKYAGHDRIMTTGNKEPLSTVQYSVSKKKPSPTSSVNLQEQFNKVAKKLKNDEFLLKCPKCAGPSMVHPVEQRGHCQNEKCALDFCIKCNSPFHQSQACYVKKRLSSTVGSKKSKRNLKRLL